MSKSLGNVIDPEDILKTMGAEILRAWVASVDYREEIRIGKESLERISEAYRKVRNTFRYLLSNLYDFQPERNSVPDQELSPLDRWAMQQLSDLTCRVLEAYRRYEYHVVYPLDLPLLRGRHERLLSGHQQGSRLRFPRGQPRAPLGPDRDVPHSEPARATDGSDLLVHRRRSLAGDAPTSAARRTPFIWWSSRPFRTTG